MNEQLICWAFMFLMMLYLLLSHCRCFQNALKSRLGECCQHLVQPHVITFLGLIVLQARSMFDLVVFDIIKYQWLKPENYQDNLDQLKKFLDDEAIESLEINHYLKYVCLAGPLAGSFALLLVFIQIMRIGSYNRSGNPKRPRLPRAFRGTCVMMVVGMPAVFIVMSTRATLRSLAIMTGSAWATRLRHAPPGSGLPYNKTLYDKLYSEELGLYEMDLELAAAFQYVVVLSFALLCGRILRRGSEADERTLKKIVPKPGDLVETQYVEKLAVNVVSSQADHAAALKSAGLLGVYAYVLIGIARSFANIFISIAESFGKSDFTKGQVEHFQQTFLAKISTLFTFATILCVINMIFMCKIKEINEAIPKSSIKFLGARALLLIAQIQPQVLQQMRTDLPTAALCISAVCKAKNACEHDADLKGICGENAIVQNWELSQEQAQLVHSSFLGVECLVVVLFNLLWGCSTPQNFSGEDSGDETSSLPVEDANNVQADAKQALQAPLLKPGTGLA